MDITVHNQIIWNGCVAASKNQKSENKIADPRAFFPLLVRGSWANDINQATAFTDQLKEYVCEENVQNFFNEMWKQEQENILKKMSAGPTEAREVSELAKKETKKEEGDYTDFGKYSSLDHLDVLKDEPEKEYTNSSQAETINGVLNLRLPSHFINSTYDATGEERLQNANVTALGRALHTIQDFFAHSNYVELLLWELAWQKKLSAEVVYGFNNPESFLAEVPYPRLYCPLPTSGADIEALTKDNAIMWFGNSPSATPLVSTLFDQRDTACSLLYMYTKQLENTTKESSQQDQFNLAISVFGYPEKSILTTAYQSYAAVKKTFDEISSHVKTFFKKIAMDIISRNPQAEKAMKAYTRIFENYSSAEARDWAEAGKIKYIEYSIKKDIAAKLKNQNKDRRQIPNHSLLHKDHEFENPEDGLRFRIAAMMASRITTEIIAEHFSVNPSEEKINQMISKRLKHPSEQIQKNELNLEVLVQFIKSAYGAPWTQISTTDPFIA